MTENDGEDAERILDSVESNDSTLSSVTRRSMIQGAAAFGGSTLLASSSVSATDDSDEPEGSDETLVETPPMGWNSWNTFYCDINAELIKEAADAMVENGLREVGYESICVDDCWMAPERDADGSLQADPETFPNGIEPVADYVHSKGLKFGIYESAGTTTCEGLPGSLGHEKQDAQTFADWGVDYLKYDNCGNHRGLSAIERYARMHEALEATDRDIVLSICEWGDNDPWFWAADVGGDLWRTTGDIKPLWSKQEDLWGNGIIDIIDQNEPLAEYAGPGQWNDPDMLVVGVDLPEYPNLTQAEDRTHFGMWAMMAAPLIAGNDIRNMSEHTQAVLTNEEVIAINQDPAGNQATRIQHITGQDGQPRSVWAKELANGDQAVGLLNRSDMRTTITTSAQAVGLDDEERYNVRDLWNGGDWQTAGLISASVPSHGLALFRVSSGSSDDSKPLATVSSTPSEVVVAPGEAITTRIEFTNVSPISLDEVQVRCTVPDDWSSKPDSMTFDDIAAGPSIVGGGGNQYNAGADWMARTPKNAEAKDYELTIATEYADGTTIETPLIVTVDESADSTPSSD
ncbi:glycoside hydrolase family 27 protein [Haloarcula hispanica]|uniref:glycoside hydrolase family 27 protein n=1 Tax=Haloarcula hispanica TaxID=51589 RepID=UPI001C9693CB|nr:glycoside hydrolase family 27 protein [Haloarcula hispanica]